MHMHMSFWWGTDLGEFLFHGLKINGTGQLIGVCIILCLLAMFFESMKIHGAKARALAAREKSSQTETAQPNESANLLAVDLPPRKPFYIKFFKFLHEFSTFVLHNFLSYALMLSVMVYNGYIFIAVIIGLGVGYFVFGHISMKINMENVQATTTANICKYNKNISEESTPDSVQVGASPSTSYNTLSHSPSEITVSGHNSKHC